MQVTGSEVPVLQQKLIKSYFNFQLFSFFLKDVFPHADLETTSVIHVAALYSLIFGPSHL